MQKLQTEPHVFSVQLSKLIRWD